MIQLKTRRASDWIDIARKAGFKIRRVAKILRVSQKQLRRNTQRLFKLNPLQWMKKLRLEAAAKLLIKLNSVTIAAERLGFKQLSHFSREFKLFHGITPRQFLTPNQKRCARRSSRARLGR
jgi:AraC-like DNA-binding protein